MADVYESLGVRPIVNAVGPATRLGGSIMDPEVLQAMREAAASCVRIDELQEAAGRAIADITGAEAGYVTPGASAGLALATAACMTGLDPVKVNQLPDITGMKHEVIIQRAHRYDYDRAYRSVGAKLIEVGFPDLTFPYELERAITPQTAAVAYYPTPSRPALPLEKVVAIAHRHDVPVIVDAALDVPPNENLRRYIALGADLVAYSGGKAIRGPQASGFLCGRASLIKAVALHHQDMDVRPETWTYRHLMDQGEMDGPPHHGIGRAMKVGKEEIVGLVVALRRFVVRDVEAERRVWSDRIDVVARALQDVPGVTVLTSVATTVPVPTATIRLDEQVLRMGAYDVLNALQDGDPRVFLNEEQAWRGELIVNPLALRDGDEHVIARRLNEVLRGAQTAEHRAAISNRSSSNGATRGELPSRRVGQQRPDA